MIPNGVWTPVVSSNVREWFWDRQAEVFGVQFKTGRPYFYAGVNAAMVLDFMAAPSKGVWVSQTFVKPGRAFTRSFA